MASRVVLGWRGDGWSRACAWGNPFVGAANGKTHRGTGLHDERQQEGDPSTGLGLIEANETGENSRLRVCVRTRHGVV